MTFIVLQNKIHGNRIVFFSNKELKSLYRLRQRLKQSTEKIQWRLFCNLTFANEVFEREASKQVRLFMNRMKTYIRKYCRDKKKEYKPQNYQYFWKVERGSENNRVHVHFFSNCYFIKRKQIEQWWVKDKELLGWVHIEPIKTKKKMLKYIGKYFSKQYAKIEFHDANRRWGCSRGVEKRQKMQSEWEFMNQYWEKDLYLETAIEKGAGIDYYNFYACDVITHYEEYMKKWFQIVVQQKSLNEYGVIKKLC